MKRLARAPLFVQAIGLVVATAIIAQLITLATVAALPGAHEQFTFGDVAEAVRSRTPVEREGQYLTVDILGARPIGWERDSRVERRARATLAKLLDVPEDRVLIENDVEVPGGGLFMRLVAPAVTGPAPPLERGADAMFEDIAAAVRLADGRWVVVATASHWLGSPISLLLLWLAGNMLVLVPLAWLFTRRLVRPIRAFAEAAEAAGRGDPSASFAEAGPSEVRKAARALDEMQRKIAASVEERTRLIAAIAHDLRTPLTRLRFRAENVAPEQRDKIVADIERMDMMIGGVLAFARGETHAHRQRVDFTSLVQSMVDDLAETGSDAALAEAVPAEVEADPIALRRLIANLLDNAVRYGGNARCRVLREGGDTLLLVEDEGPSIPDDSLERVFTPFERGDAARDPATGGVGLGLALARGIARAHGGEVWLTKREGRGLCAHLRLPAAPAESAAGPKL
jgi:two-component system OmpR family sensor kinase